MDAEGESNRVRDGRAEPNSLGLCCEPVAGFGIYRLLIPLPTRRLKCIRASLTRHDHLDRKGQNAEPRHFQI